MCAFQKLVKTGKLNHSSCASWHQYPEFYRSPVGTAINGCKKIEVTYWLNAKRSNTIVKNPPYYWTNISEFESEGADNSAGIEPPPP